MEPSAQPIVNPSAIFRETGDGWAVLVNKCRYCFYADEMAALFDLPNNVGVTNSLLREDDSGVDGWLLPTCVENLYLLPSGPLPPNPAELVGSQRMHQLIEHLERQFDVIVFDSPPVLAVTDAAVLSRQVDGVLVVVEAGGTRQKEAHRTREELSRVNAPILGVVINQVPVNRREGYYYYDRQGASGGRGTA